MEPADLLNGCALGYGQQLARLWAAQADAVTAEAAGDPDTLTRALGALRAEQQVTDRLFDLLVSAARAATPTVTRR